MSRNTDVTHDRTKKQLQAKTARARSKRADQVAIASRAAGPRRNDLEPDQTVERRAIDALKPANRRVRDQEAVQLAGLIESIANFGQAQPILIDPDDRIVCGHNVWSAMRELGCETINCIVLEHLTAEERRAYAIADARLGELGSWNMEELKVEMEELQVADIDLRVTAFTEPEIDIILGSSGDADDDDGTADEPSDDPIVVRSGDLFLLGKHRIICGDALEADTYVQLLEGQQVAAVMSDPPYNCPIQGFVSGLGKHQHEDFALGVGEMSKDEFRRFLGCYLERCARHCIDGAVLFAFMDWRQIEVLLLAGEDAGLTRQHVAVWNKGVGAMGSLYRSAHEFCAVFSQGERIATNNVELGRHGRDRTSVWNYAGATRRGSSAAKALADHPTPKPVELVADALLDVTARGEAVLDPFLGSGTTVIAAEKAGRVAYGIELEPKYVDRSIRRWERLTSGRAVHIATGFSFGELAARRRDEVHEAAESSQRDGRHDRDDRSDGVAIAPDRTCHFQGRETEQEIGAYGVKEDARRSDAGDDGST